jgi:hypothetical protein
MGKYGGHMGKYGGHMGKNGEPIYLSRVVHNYVVERGWSANEHYTLFDRMKANVILK